MPRSPARASSWKRCNWHSCAAIGPAARFTSSSTIRLDSPQRLRKEGELDEAAVNELIAERIRRYEAALARAKKVAGQKSAAPATAPEIAEIDGSKVVETTVSNEQIHQITGQISVVPEGFNL